MIGTSPAMQAVLEQMRLVAPTCSTVLIQGETGTGKELVAQAIHDLSPRRDAPLVKVNCAAIPAGLIESELFGHERGAFTGALMRRMGRFELANRGTVFLDEIGEIAPDLQVKLLRLIQEQQFERLGSAHTTRVDVRLVAATNRNLAEMVAAREFRADLFYRLSVFPLSLPPLRKRQSDIPELVWHFIAKYSTSMNKTIDQIPEETMEAILAYDWPGNVRQLQNFVEHGVIVSQGPVFRPNLSQLQRQTASPVINIKTLEEATRDHVLRTLEQTRWVVGGRHGAAARLGIARTTLVSKMRRLGIEFAREQTLAKDVHRQRAVGATA
ncbi:MAG TPA: sigma 54-interacting transcriptional regulator [Bryobacteraceae bacterium]|nr:sigma 54-interacting transcriptional regulator [Bryobacteraceae bacterium]